MLSRSRSRRSSFAYAYSTTATPTFELDTITPGTPLPCSPPPPPPTDPEGLWVIRAPEWSWTPRHPSTPSMSLTPPPEDALYPPSLYNTCAWTPLQSARCVRTGREQLPVRQTYVFNNDAATRHPGCLACSDGYAAWVRESLRESWGVVESEMDEMCSGVVGLGLDEQRGWGLHARVWHHSLGNCVCKELEGWYPPEHTPGQGHDDDEEEGEEGYEEVLDAMRQPGYEGLSDHDDGCSASASEWDELRTPADGGALYMDLPPAQDGKPAPTLAMETTPAAAAVVNPEEEANGSSPVISSKSLLSRGPSSALSPKTTRWMDLDDEDLEELPDLSDW